MDYKINHFIFQLSRASVAIYRTRNLTNNVDVTRI